MGLSQNFDDKLTRAVASLYQDCIIFSTRKSPIHV